MQDKSKRIQRTIIFVIMFSYISFYIPAPYLITEPGSAMELTPLVEVKQGYQSKGDFMMTTIAVMPASMASLFLSYIDDYSRSIPEGLILQENESPDQYSKRQLMIMQNSQDEAIITAFHYLNIPIKIKEDGVLVAGLISGMPGEKVLKVGDVIKRIDKHVVNNRDELITYLERKEPSEQLKLEYLREGKLHETNLFVKKIGEASSRVGIGFIPLNARQVKPSKKITFHTEEIGGPSAGFMFTLELIDQLIAQDLTKGYKIAGTGQILSKGKIGQIGGADFKVKAAYENGADIFFVPKDTLPEDTNEMEAQATNKDLGNPIKIVPISDIEEAIEYLNHLPVKQ